MAGINMNEISVPVRLKVIQDSISDFQKILDNLQPNTKNWKDLNRLISQMSSEASRLQAQISKPFSSEKQFNSAEKVLDKLEESAARMKIVMEGLKFSDIKLTPQQTQELQQFDDEINQIRASYKQLKEDTKKQLLSNDDNKNLLGLIPRKDVLNKDFDEIKIAVDQHVKNLERSVENQKRQFDRLKSNIELGERATTLTSSDGGLTREALGDSIFDKYLSQTEKGLRIKSWNNGITKQALLKELEEMFSLTPGELQGLADKTIGEINKAFQEMGKKGQINPLEAVIARGKNSKKTEATTQLAVNELQEQLKQYQALQEEINRLKNTTVDPAENTNTAKIDELTGKMNTLRQAIVANITTNSNYKNSMQDFSAGLGQARTALQETSAEFLRMEQIRNSFNSMKTMIANFMGFHQVLNLTRKAVQEAAQHIKELDTVMNGISIVTNMDTSDLWGQIDQYSKMAQTYGTTIKGAYEVSQIYYQQGLETADVLTLTNETLKLAKVSGLDYASTTDYMTTALRGFKMEMSEASTVVDVYSNLAANTAVSQEELAVAMSKTASSMESVGSSFEETSAMIATMVAVTRESATNIGSALKSIAARYGEMKSDPLAMTDADGEELVYNKVDAALQSVGITLKDTEGQFRNFTEVITELAEKWDTLESTQQRYIATQFAGNRQQSRFLALISNKELLAENIAVAESSADVGTAQVLKALDSLESKIEQVRVAYQQFYTTIGVESVWKGFLDGAKSVINTLNGMPKLFGKFPLAALNAIAQVITLIKNVAFAGLAKLAQQLGPILVSGVSKTNDAARQAGESWVDSLLLGIKGKSGTITSAGELINSYLQKGLINKGLIGGKELNRFQNYSKMDLNDQDIRNQIGKELKTSGFISDAGFQHFTQDGKQAAGMLQAFIQQAQQAQSRTAILGNAIQSTGQLFAGLALVIDTTTRGGKEASGAMTAFSGAVSMLGIVVANVDKELKEIPWYAVASAALSIITGLIQLWNANSIEAQLEETTAKAEELNNKAKELKANYNTLDTSIKKLQELEKTRYDSAEAAEEYQTAVDKLAETYPQLISSYDEQNRAVLNVNAIERVLAQARDETADATLRAAQAEALRLKTEQENHKNNLHLDNNALQKAMYPLQLEQASLSDDYDRFYSPLARQLSNINTKKRITDIYTDSYTRTYGEQLSEFIAAINNAAENNNPKLVLSTFESLQNFLNENLFQLDKSLMDPIRELVNSAKDYYQYDEKIDTANRLLVSSQLDYEYRGTKSQSILKDSQGLFDRATQYLYEEINSTSQDFSPENISHEAKKIVSKIDGLFIGITDDRKKELENILEHPESYNIEDLPDELKDIGWIKKAYESSAASSVEEVNNKLNDLLNQESKTALTNEEVEKFRDLANKSTTLNLRNLTNAGIKQAQTLKKNGQNPDEFIEQFIDFYNQVATLPANLRNSIIENFTANGFTKEGLQKTQAWLNSEEIKAQLPKDSKVDLEPMIKSFVPNLSLTLQTMNDALTENLGDYESLFSDLSGGIKGSKLSKTIASAEKLLGVKLKFEDFEANGEQFILSTTKFNDTIAALREKFGKNIDDYDDQIDEISKAIQAGKISDEGQQKLILGADYATYFDEAGQLKEGVDSDQVAEELLSRGQTLVTLYNDYQSYSNAVLDQLEKTSKWKQGDYSSLGEGAYEKIQNYAANKDSRKEEFYSSPDWTNAVEMYQSGISSALSDLTTYGLDYVKNKTANKQYKGVDNTKLAKELEGKTNDNIIELTRAWANQAGKSVSEVNSLVIKAIDTQKGLGKNKAAVNLISGGSFTGDDLNQFLSSYFPDRDIEQYIDNAGNLKGQLGEIYHFDQATASYKLNDTATFEDVIKAYEDTFTTTIIAGDELYKQLYKDWIDNKIKDADKKDSGKQFASVLSTLSSAKVGTRVSLVDSPELKSALEKMGIKIEDDTYEVMSEYARDNLILALESTDAEVNAVLNPLKESINQKRAKGTAQKGVMSKTFTRENFKNYLKYATNRGSWVDSYTNQYLNDIAKSHGFTWSEELQQYILTNYAKAIEWYDSMIKEAVDQKKDPEYIKQLRQERGRIVTEFNKDEKYEALSNLLTNYEDAGSYIDEINTQFEIDLRTIEGAVTKVNGKEVIDKDKVRTALGTAADQYSFLFDNLTDQIADTYIDNISKAGTLAMTGTSSQVEMEGFKKAFQKIFPNKKPTFIYDALLNSWTLDINDAIRMIEESAKNENINFGSEADRQAYIQNQIDNLFADNLDFSKFLAGTATEKENVTLRSNLEKYYKSRLRGATSNLGISVNELVENSLETLSAGGQAAIDVLRSIKKDKLTTEEIQAAYRAQVEPIKAVFNTIKDLQAGSIVAKNQIDILISAGFDVNQDGVITTVGNLIDAYSSLYTMMKNTGEATIAELNTAMGTFLDNTDGEQQAIDALNNAAGMTYSQFAEIYTKAGIELTSEMVSQMRTSGIIKHLGGNKMMISNFESFASTMGWDPTSEAYLEGLKSYRTSMIEYDKKTATAIKSEFDAVSNAKVNEKINITQLVNTYGEDAIKLALEGYAYTLEDGILSITNSSDIAMIASKIGAFTVSIGGMLQSELDSYIAAQQDAVLNEIVSANKLITSGTSSITEMQDFTTKFNEITGSTLQYSDLFEYDTLLDTFVINNSNLEQYTAAQKVALEQLGLSGQAIDDYINDQTQTILQQNISLDNFLKETNIDKRNKEATKVFNQIKQLSNYKEIARNAISVKYKDYGKELQAGLAETEDYASQAIIEIIDNGGKDAVDLLKQIKGEHVTSDELIEVYNSSIEKLRTAYTDVGKKVGESVSGPAIEILAAAGYTFETLEDGTAVITAVGDMAQAYANVYKQMQANAEHTTADLNNTFVSMLNADDQSRNNILESLKNASGMSYEALGKIFTSQNKLLENALMNEVTAAEYGLERNYLGQVKITNWDAFVTKVFEGQEQNLEYIKNTPEYLSAFTAYNNSLIELNQKTEKAITDEVKQITSMKRGSQLNLTNFWNILDNQLSEALANIIPDWYNGNVSNLDSRVRVPMDAMQQVFSEFTDDYATLYSETFAGSEFDAALSNVGLLFTHITESGELVGDLNTYISTLIQQSYKEFGEVTAQTIQIFDAENKNLLLSADEFDFSDTAKIIEAMNIKGEEAHKLAEKADNIRYFYDVLQSYGATFENGILSISDNANLFGIAQTIGDMVEYSGVEIEDGLEAVQDAIQAVLKSYVEAISKGIEGGLTNVEAADLRSKAADLGVHSLRFEETVEGLKLSQASAIELYQALSKVDNLQGKIVFDKLSQSLTETNEKFATTSALLNHIQELTKQIRAADEKVSSARLEQYKAELEVAKQIVAIRSTEEDDSFNFMSNKIPAGQNNPLNYAKNLTQAMKAINDAYKVKNTKYKSKGHTETGYMAYEDFYNIVNELNNMAGAMKTPIQIGKTIEGDALILNGSLESASDLILKGIDTLTAVDTGDMMVNIGGLGMTLAKGGDELKTGIQSGVKAIADAQISALDGMIAMLELIVAMESLGDVAGEDMVIELPDIVTDDKNLDSDGDRLSDTFETWREKFLADGTKSREIAESITLDGQKMVDWLNREASEWTDNDAAILNALYQAAIDSNYNIDEVGKSLQEILNSKKFGEIADDFNITVDDVTYTVSNGIVVEAANWKDEDVQAAVKDYKNRHKIQDDQKVRTAIVKQIQDYLNGSFSGSREDLITVLKVHHSTLIQHDKDGDYIVGPDGKHYKEGSPEWNKAISKQILQDQSYIGKREGDISWAGEKAEQTIEYGTKTKIKMKATADVDGNVTWEKADFSALGDEWKDFNPTDAKNQQELLDLMYKYAYTNNIDGAAIYDSKEAWIYSTFGIHVAVKTEVLNSEGQPLTDTTKDAKFKEKLKTFQTELNNNKDKELKEYKEIVNDGKGTTTITLENGYQIKLDTDDISYDGTNIDKGLLNEKLNQLLGFDTNLKDTITQSITAALETLPSVIENIKTDGLDGLAAAMERLANAAQLLQNTQWGTISEGINSLNKPQQQQQPNQESGAQTTTETTNITTIVTKFEPDTKAVENAKKEISDEPVTMKIDGDERDAIDAGEDAKAAISAMRASISITATNSATSVIMGIKAALDKLVNGGPYKVTVQASVSQAKGNIGRSKTPINNKETLTTNYISATGTVGLAKSKGTLMGELGPELVVSKGRYFVVGQSGPEMVDLADDAIVFNHLQTQSLLTKGMSNGRGHAVTNERNAISFATGNVDGGPAMASASAALAALKQLRAMWESLRNASVSDLAGAGGGGGGGGGGNKIVDPKAWVKTVERWYNLTQEIAKLEKDITHEETLRSKLQSDFNKNGKHYYQSQKQSLSSLKQQIAAQEQLNLSRQDYYTKRVDALKNEPLGKLYTFDENGQMHFRDDVTMNGQKGAMNFLTNLMGFDENGKANYTNEQKYNILKRYGFDEYMKYNSNGEQILLDADHSGDVTDEERETYYQQATEAWRDRMDNFASETQSLWDSIQEGENSLLELQTSQNELLQEMRDNQMDLEDEVLKAIEDMRQREIDALQDERDKLEESTGKYIQGLSDALNKEQEMYNNQEQENDLNQQRRRLAILQRSGGSAADIANLQNEINSNERSQYFDLQQQQIDAIQNASDLQIERMDDQIQLMTETLEYQKEYGLLWGDVYQVMNESAARITNFIMGANSEFWAKSPLGSATEMNEILFKAEQWEGFREDVKDVSTDVAALAFATREEMKANDYKIYNDAMTKEFGANYDKSGKYKGIFESVYEETGDLTKASAAARAEYQKDKKAEEEKKKAAVTQTVTQNSAPAPASASAASNNSSNNGCRGCAAECTKGCAYSCVGQCGKNSCKNGCKTGCNNTCTGTCKGGPNDIDNPALYQGINRSNISKKASANIPKKAVGGFVKHGIYELGEKGTEGIFNARQTRILRDNILSNKPNSLVTLLNTYNEAYKDGISVAPQEASEQLIIENATVNMNVQQIANDYDARRAGEQALNEMMRIARKTSAANSIRR